MVNMVIRFGYIVKLLVKVGCWTMSNGRAFPVKTSL